MSNALYNSIGGNNNMQGLIQRFQQFKNSFNGNAQQQVQQLLNSGKVSQQQYDEAVKMANQLQALIK